MDFHCIFQHTDKPNVILYCPFKDQFPICVVLLANHQLSVYIRT